MKITSEKFWWPQTALLIVHVYSITSGRPRVLEQSKFDCVLAQMLFIPVYRWGSTKPKIITNEILYASTTVDMRYASKFTQT